MAVIEQPITLEEQVLMMKKYVLFRQKKKMRDFLNYAGYFRASRYGKFLLSQVEAVGSKSKQDALFSLYWFDVELRRILTYYCNRAEVRFKSAVSNACAIQIQNGTFYLDKQFYTPSQGEKDAKKRKQNIAFFHNGGNRQSNKLPVWVAFSYFDFGTVTMMYNYLRGDLRKSVLVYSFQKGNYAKRDTELVDT